jgi:hypothetical protein
VTGGALNLNCTGYPDRGRYGNLSLQGKIPTAEPGIRPGTPCLVVRSSDHQASMLVAKIYVLYKINYCEPPHLTELTCDMVIFIRLHLQRFSLMMALVQIRNM